MRVSEEKSLEYVCMVGRGYEMSLQRVVSRLRAREGKKSNKLKRLFAKQHHMYMQTIGQPDAAVE